MKIYITGANGQLGSDLFKVLSKGHNVAGGGRDTFNIENTDAFLEHIKGKFDMLINTAAFHNVPMCEKEHGKAFLYNRDIPGRMAKYCRENDIAFMHFSTDYVFDGKKHAPYSEEDKPNPLNVYGKSKYEGEQMVMDNNSDAMILRVCGLYGRVVSRIKGYNFVTMMLEKGRQGSVSVVEDQILTPTHTLNVARQVERILGSDLKGIVHCTDNGEVSWYNFAKEIFSIAGMDTEVKPLKTYNDGVDRPEYSVLDNKKLSDNDMDIMPVWNEALREYLGLINEAVS